MMNGKRSEDLQNTLSAFSHRVDSHTINFRLPHCLHCCPTQALFSLSENSEIPNALRVT